MWNKMFQSHFVKIRYIHFFILLAYYLYTVVVLRRFGLLL